MKVTFVGPNGRTWDAGRIVRNAAAYLENQGVWPQWQLESFRDVEKAHWRTARAKYIVLLDPIVVLGPTEGSLPENYLPTSVKEGLSSRSTVTSAPRADETVDVRYPEGFFTGRRIPWHDDMQWFSPQLKIGPVPLRDSQVAPGRYEIHAGHTTLLLWREGDELVVDVAPAKK